MMERIKRFSVPIIISLVAGLLVTVWFREGFILGAAEAEIPFYKLQRFEQKTAWSWTDFHLGNNSGATVASWPTYWLLSQIQNIGVSGFVIQALFFWLIFVSAGIGMYWLIKDLLPNLGKKYFLLAVFFYFFNPISLVNVWNRFLYNYMVFWAMLPLVLCLFIKGLQQKRYIFSLFSALVLTLFSYALSGYVFNILIWFVLFFTWLSFIFLEKKFTFFSIKFFILTLTFFALLNSWWILPTLSYVSSETTGKELAYFVNTAGNLYTLNILSQKLGNLTDVVRLTHAGFYLNEGPQWANWYSSPLLTAISFIITGVIFFAIIKLKKYKEALFLGILYIAGLFLTKGNNSPFGQLFLLFFEKIAILQIFRDPFEKFGFIVALSAAPLFALGIKELSGIFKERFKLLIYITGLFIVLGFFGYPFFTGLVFTSKSPPNNDPAIGYKVKVPDYYQEANNWLESQGRNFRFISFPLGDEGMTYQWEKGYQGVEPSGILFSISNISFNTTIPYYYQMVEKLERLLFEDENFYKVANLLNVRYFLVRSDVDIAERRLRKSEAIEEVISKGENEGKVKKVVQFGKLTFWENLKWEDKTVYAANYLLAVYPQPKISEVLFPQVDNEIVLLGPTEEIKDKEDQVIIYPETSASYQNKERCFQSVENFDNPKKYSVNIPETADYELLLDDVNLFPDEASLADQIKVSVNNNPLSGNSQPAKNNRISFGEINLIAGKHEIIIERPITPNLVSAPGDIHIRTIQGNNQAAFKISNFNPYARYLTNFDYSLRLGQQFMFFFQQNNDMFREGQVIPECMNIDIFGQGSNLGNFTHARDIFTPKRSDEAVVLFWTNPGQNVELIVKNLSVNRLIEPQPVLVKKNPKILPDAPKVTYTKINPTKYIVSVKGSKGPFILVLSELFNSGWQAKFDDKALSDNHFLANAYANGWLIEKTGDFDMTLEFAPQKMLNIGSAISTISILVGLVYIGSILIKKKGI